MCGQRLVQQEFQWSPPVQTRDPIQNLNLFTDIQLPPVHYNLSTTGVPHQYVIYVDQGWPTYSLCASVGTRKLSK